MKTVSTEYKESMAASLRNRSYARIIFDNINTKAYTDGYQYTTGNLLPYSNKETLGYDYDYLGTVATLEPNRWTLDGSNYVLPDEDTIVRDGLAWEALSDVHGLCPTAAFDCNFLKPMDTIGITLKFDPQSQEYPTEVMVTLRYGESGSGDSEQFHVYPTSPTVTVDTPGLSVRGISLLFINSGLPYRRPRVKAIFLGMVDVYENDDIISIQQKHDIDPLSRRLPQENLTFTIHDFEHHYNPETDEGFYDITDGTAPVNVQFGYELNDGTVEWLKPDRYVISGKPQIDNGRVTFTAQGLIGSMSENYYKSQFGEKSFYDMAEDVLRDANLRPTPTGNDPWGIDDSLNNLYTTAVLPNDLHMNCLQLIAHACGCQLYSDDDNVIHIKPFSLAAEHTDFSLMLGDVYEGSPAVNRVDKLKQVTVAKYSYVVNDSVSTLYEETVTDTKLHVDFPSPAQDVIITVDGGSIIGEADVYAQAADMILTPGTKTVTITGKTVSKNSTVLTFDNSPEGETDAEENELITSDAMAESLAAHVAAYLQYRNTYTADYRGNPELETRDIIQLETPFSKEQDTTIPALVLTDEINFDGALSGNLTLKGLI